MRVWTGESPARFEVDGIVHRRPVTRPVTARLVAAGAPLIIRHADPRTGAPC